MLLLAAQPPKEAVQALVLLLAAQRAHVMNSLVTLLPGEAAGSTPFGGAPTETSAMPKLVLLLAARPRRVLLLAARPRRRGREEGACLHGLPLRLFLSTNPSPRLTRPPVLLLAARREKGERRGKGGSPVPLPAARGGVLALRLRPRLCDRVLLLAARFPRPRMPKRYACVAAGSQRPPGIRPLLRHRLRRSRTHDPERTMWLRRLIHCVGALARLFNPLLEGALKRVQMDVFAYGSALET